MAFGAGRRLVIARRDAELSVVQVRESGRGGGWVMAGERGWGRPFEGAAWKIGESNLRCPGGWSVLVEVATLAATH